MAESTKKLDYKKTILTGFGFLATTIAWGIYDPYITKILNKILSSSEAVTTLSNKLAELIPWIGRFAEAQGESTVSLGGGFTLVPLFIGIIMTFDNIFGVIFQPTFGKLSDNCHSKMGRRKPFIVTCAPISALLFALIPIVAFGVPHQYQLVATMLMVILFVFSMSLWRAPVVALMPDLTPPELRSEGNAVINLMGGIGSALAMLAGTIATFISIHIAGKTEAQIDADETVIFPYVFLIGAIVMIVGMLVVLFFVHEKDTSIKLKGEMNQYADEKARRKALKAAAKAEKAALKAQKLTKSERKSLAFMLMTLFFLFCGTNAITTFFSLFAQEVLHLSTSKATIVMLVFAVVAGIAALPAGKMGKKLGRKKTIITGLSVFLSAFIVFFAVFSVMLGSKGLSMGRYTKINTKVYTTMEDAINGYNSTLTDDSALVSFDGYIEFKQAQEKGENISGYEAYVDFDKYFVTECQGEEVAAAIVGVVKENHERAKGNITFSEALKLTKTSVDEISAILQIIIYPVLILAGAANMFITVNTLPLVLDIGGIEKVGTFTGYYYTATFSAQIASPIIYGFIRMFAGSYISLFYYAPIMFALAITLILFVKHGEAVPDEIVEQIEMENED